MKRVLAAGVVAALFALTGCQPVALDKTNCFAVPSVCGLPDSTNTGVPAGQVLTPSGSINATTAGQLISNKDVTGTINVSAPNVTIQNTRVTQNTTCGSTSTCGNYAIRLLPGANGTKILYSETRTQAGQTCEHDIRNQADPNLQVNTAYLHACDSNIYSAGNTAIANVYGVAKIAISQDHVENIYFDDSTFSMIHSTLVSPVEQTANIFGNVNNGSGGSCQNHLTVALSLLAGGGYSIYPCGNGTSSGTSAVDIEGNRFARCGFGNEVAGSGGHWLCPGGTDTHGYYPRGGSYGLEAFGFNEVWRSNAWDDAPTAYICSDRNPGCP